MDLGPTDYPAGTTPEASLPPDYTRGFQAVKPEFDEDDQRYPDGPRYGAPGTGMPPGHTPPPAQPYVNPHQPYPWLGGVPPQMQSNQTVVNLTGRRPFNHTFHLLATIVSCGMWAPVWLVAYLLHQKG